MIAARTRRTTKASLDWLVFIGWIALITAALFPASWWFDLRAVEVTNTFTADGERIVRIDRTIHRSFHGDWSIEQQLRRPDGTYLTIRICKGASHFYTDRALPEPATLEWFLGNDCEWRVRYKIITPGLYRVCTWINISPTWLPTKHIKNCSNDYAERD